MKELGSWIPQVFYDLIGRVAPGTFLLLVASGLFNDVRFVAEALEFASSLETTEAVSLGLALSYMLSVVLGGLGYLMLDHQLFTDVKSITAEVPTSLNAPDMSDGQIAFLYDALQYHNPAAGARLAKLRAEQHMCCVLMVGVIVLVVVRVAMALLASASLRGSALGGLIVAAISARAFFLHLEVRSQRLMVNYCQLLTELRTNLAGPGDQPVQVANLRLQLTAAERLRLLFWWGRRR